MEVFSKSTAAFDSAACAYDAEFTNTPIGKLQRERVRHFLKSNLHEKPLRILEINCGTGEDALWLGQSGNKVIATDSSAAMIKEAQEKISTSGLNNSIEATRASFSELAEKFKGEKFDLLFSNFGGLNCVSEAELKKLSADFSSLLNKNGKLIAVVMGRKCLWERFYFSVKGKFKAAFRRNSREPVIANVSNQKFSTWYFTPKEFRQNFETDFDFVRAKPVGLFLPPSYLNCFFTGKKFLLNLFNAAEKLFPFSFLSDLADHYFIELKKHSDS